MKKALLLALVLIAFSSYSVKAAIPISKKNLNAIVYILTPDSTGSGTVIDNDTGLIMTNYHVVFDEFGFSKKNIYICYTINERSIPICLASARVLSGYDDADVAFLLPNKYIDSDFRITNESIYKTINEFEAVTFKSLNDNDGIPSLNEEIAILGYPGAGGETITATNGYVSGYETSGYNLGQFTSRINSIKTDAKINPGNSGGAAIDKNNRFIGIPYLVNTSGFDTIGYIIPMPTILLAIEDAKKHGDFAGNEISALNETSQNFIQPNPIVPPQPNEDIYLPTPKNLTQKTIGKNVIVSWKVSSTRKDIHFEYLLSNKKYSTVANDSSVRWTPTSKKAVSFSNKNRRNKKMYLYLRTTDWGDHTSSVTSIRVKF